jgi:uncharacterized membrane protein YgdD (TMEM256/DUF423 family)
MHKGFLLLSSILGALAVGLGAFGAHGLKKIVGAEIVAAFETAVRYQFYHVFALLATAIIYEKFPDKFLRWAGNCFVTGIVLFSGSLYLLTIIKATGSVGVSGIGIITPFGGLFFIAGWLLLFFGLIKRKNPASTK